MSAWRRPLFTAFVFGCGVSAAASGRFSARLIADGMVSFAFVPVFDLLALALVTRARRREPRPFAATVADYFAGNTALLLWWIAVAALFAVVPPRDAGRLFEPVLVSAALPIAWCLVVDLRFYRATRTGPAGGAANGRARGAGLDLVIHRALSWSACTAWFLGIAIWHEIVPRLAGGAR